MGEAHVDEVMISELKEVMGEDFTVLLETFLSDSKQRLAVVQQAISEETSEELRQAAHSFKGSSGNIGAPLLSSICKELEDLGRSGSVSGAKPLLEQLQEEFAAVEEIMRSYF
jgi:HPt (histidine-containing phosphotransfer) domain-containing protein